MFEKRIISFQVGAGGNFLANFLSDDDVNVEADFRIDWPRQKNPLIASFAPVTLDELVVADFLRKVDEWTKQTKTQTLITHYRNISNFIKYKDSCWFRKIVPGKHILTYCKNVWYKKRELDIEAFQSTSLQSQVDTMFFNIVEFYNYTKDDIDCPEDYLIEFCRLYDVDFLKNLYQEVNGKTAPLSKIDWANEWISKQFRLYEYTDSQNIEEIIKIINPQDAFDLAAVLFTYENNWNTLNQSRMWTINELPNTIEESKKFLISNAHNYTFFKD